MSADPSAPALEVSDLDLVYRVRGIDRPVLRGVSLSIGRGRSYGLVGESGCGKSTAALGIVRYLPRNGRVTGGTISVAGQNVLALGRRALREYHARTVSMVYQNPGSALNPSLKIGTQVAEAFTVLGVPAKEARERGQAALVARTDRRPVERDEPVPAPALGRHAAAGRDRDGAGQESGAPHPRRADDGPRRDGRGGGARSRRADPAEKWTPPSSSSATTWASSRRCATASACCTPGGSSRRDRSRRSCRTHATRTPSGCCDAFRAEGFARTTAGWTRFRGSSRRSVLTSPAASSPTAARSPTTAATRRSPRPSSSRRAMRAGAGTTNARAGSRGQWRPTSSFLESTARSRRSSSWTSSRRSSPNAGTPSTPSPASARRSGPARRSASSASRGAGRRRSHARCWASSLRRPAARPSRGNRCPSATRSGHGRSYVRSRSSSRTRTRPSTAGTRCAASCFAPSASSPASRDEPRRSGCTTSPLAYG